MVAFVLFIDPVARIFGLAELNASMYLLAILLSLVPIPVIELAKLAGVMRHRD